MFRYSGSFSILVISLGVLTITSAQPPHYEYMVQLAEAAVEDCYEDTAHQMKIDVTNEGFDALLRGSRNNLPRNTKCIRYCIMRKNQLFDETVSLNMEQMLNLFKIVHPTIDETLLQDVLDKCGKAAVQQADRCDRAHELAMCIIGALKDQGVTDI